MTRREILASVLMGVSVGDGPRRDSCPPVVVPEIDFSRLPTSLIHRSLAGEASADDLKAYSAR